MLKSQRASSILAVSPAQCQSLLRQETIRLKQAHISNSALGECVIPLPRRCTHCCAYVNAEIDFAKLRIQVSGGSIARPHLSSLFAVLCSC